MNPTLGIYLKVSPKTSVTYSTRCPSRTARNMYMAHRVWGPKSHDRGAGTAVIHSVPLNDMRAGAPGQSQQRSRYEGTQGDCLLDKTQEEKRKKKKCIMYGVLFAYLCKKKNQMNTWSPWYLTSICSKGSTNNKMMNTGLIILASKGGKSQGN